MPRRLRFGIPVLGLATAAALLLPLVAIFRNPIQINHDAAVCLMAADQIRSGATLYVDIVDTNPPLLYYLHVLPVALARRLGAPLVVTFMLAIWSLTVASAIATYRLSRRALGARTAHPGLMAMAVAAFSALLIVRVDYGQREHLFVLALFPYIAMRICRARGVPLRGAPAFATGVLMAVAACLKPHFVVIALAIEGYLFLAVRTSRLVRAPELAGLWLTGCAYAASLLMLPSAMRDPWFSRWLPLVASGYRAYDEPMWALIRGAVGVWLPPAAALLLFVDRREGPAVLFARTFVVAAAAGVVSFLQQHKGWGYHGIPVEMAMAGVAACVAGDVVEWMRPRIGTVRVGQWRAIAGAVLASMVFTEGITAAAYGIQSSTSARLAKAAASQELPHAVATYSGPGDSVLAIATTVVVGYPVLTQFDRRPGSRFVFSFPLPMLYFGTAYAAGQPFPYDLPSGWRRDEEARFRREMQEDIAARRPAVILVGTRDQCQACPPGFVLEDYLAHTGFLREAMHDYVRVEVGARASVYVRAPR